jgi:quercetin dioxygenase-like cupin family protein
VVSKTLKQNPAPSDAVVHVIDGEGHFIIGGEENNHPEGQLIIIPAHVPVIFFG